MGQASSHVYVPPSDQRAAQINDIAADANVILIPFSILGREAKLSPSAPLLCKGCGGCFNCYSEITPKGDYLQKMKEECGEVENDAEKAEEEKSGDTKKKWVKNLKDEDKVWICEFCGIHNLIPSDTFLVEGEEQLYLLE